MTQWISNERSILLSSHLSLFLTVFYVVHCGKHDKTFLIFHWRRHDDVLTLIALTSIEKSLLIDFVPPGALLLPIMMASTPFKRVLTRYGRCVDLCLAQRATSSLISLWFNENSPKNWWGIVALSPYICLDISSRMHSKFFVYSLWQKAHQPLYSIATITLYFSVHTQPYTGLYKTETLPQ